MSVGSGYLVSPTLALTARHVVEGAQSADVVFTIRDPVRPLAVPAGIAWTGAGLACDIALLRMRWAGGAPPWPVTTAAFGDVSPHSLELPFEALGFPSQKTRSLPGNRELRDNDDVSGVILGARNLRSGLLDLQLAARPTGDGKAWTGLSGAAVFARGYLVGVIVQAKRATAELIAHRVAVPGGSFRSLSVSFAEPDDSIARFRELLATDGHDLRIAPARRRTRYAATVDQMAENLRRGGGLRGREPELAELRAFARPGRYGSGQPYAEWVAPAWSGKTSLAAQFASDPPSGADVIAFFVSRSAGSAGRQQAREFWTEACDQLAALVDRPASLIAGRAEFVRLWAEAATLAERSGRTLVLLIDGLDEDDELPLIANAIPGDGDQTRRVIVLRRNEPELRLPAEHPLNDPRRHVRKALVRTGYVKDRQAEAWNTLHAFLTGRQADALGVIAAAGPISARDIAAVLCAEDPSLPASQLLSSREISPALHRAEGAGLLVPVASDPQTFTFHHPTLQTITREHLAEDGVIGLHQDTINRLAAQYAGQGWPDSTPSYLLTGYPAFLEDAGDTARLAALTTRQRITRLRARTGDDAAAVGELTRALGKLTETRPGDIPATGRLALRREQLLQALARYPVPLIEAHAALGHWQRAEQVALYQAQPAARAAGLAGMAATAARAGQGQRADLLFARALRVLPLVTGQAQLAAQRLSLATIAATSGRLVAPRAVATLFPSPQENAAALLDFASAYASAGLIDYAEQFMAEVTGPEGPLAIAAAQADAALAAGHQPRDHGASYGLPADPSVPGVAQRQATIQQHLNIGQMLAAVAQLVIQAAARNRRLDTVIRIIAAPPGNIPPYLIGDACRTAEVSGVPQDMTGALTSAYEAAKDLADPVVRAVSLGIIAAFAHSVAAGQAGCEQLAGDAAALAQQALASAPPDLRAEIGNVIAAASVEPPIGFLIDWIRDAVTRSGDAAVRAASLTVAAQAAATAGLPTVAGLVAKARDAASKIPDPVPRALALAVLAQALAVTAQYAALQEAAADVINAARFARSARLTAAMHLAAGQAILTNPGTLPPGDLQASSAQAFAGGQLTTIRSIAASLADPARRAAANDALVKAAAAEPAAGLAAEARRAVAEIPDLQQQASIRGTIARGLAAAGQCGAALMITADMAGPDQQVWAAGMIAQAAVPAGLPADDLITAARDTAVEIDDARQQQAAFAALAPAAAAIGRLDVAEFAAAKLADPGQQAEALGIVIQAAATAGQPAGDLIAAAGRAARAIQRRAQRTWALAGLARDVAVIDQAGAAEHLVSEAEQDVLADDPVLRAGVFAAMSRSADLLVAAGVGQHGQSVLFFDQACQAADVPDTALRAQALAEISRYAPGRDGWPARLETEARRVADVADPAVHSEALTALVLAAKRSDADDLALAIAQRIPDSGLRLAALITLARSAAAKEDYARAEALCGQAGLAVTDLRALPWAGQAISSARAFCASLRTLREGRGGGLDSMHALLGNEPLGVLVVDGSEEKAISRAVQAAGYSSLIAATAYRVSDPSRHGYLLAEVAERQLAAGDFAQAQETLSAAPAPGTPGDRGADGRLLAMTVAALAVRDEAAARAGLTSGMAGFFSAELVAVMGGLDPAALAALARELSDALA